MRITLIHWIFMSLSVLLIVGAVIYAKSASRSLEGFSVSGHTASGYMVAGMLVGTMMGGSMTVGTVQSVTIGGLHGIWMLLGACIGFIVTGLFYVSPIRRSGQSTLGGYIALYYGSFTGTAMSLVSTLGIFFSLVASGLSGIHFIRLFLPVSVWQAVIILLLSVYVYVLIGGIKGTGISGLIKTSLLYFTLATAGLMAWQELYMLDPDWYRSDQFVISDAGMAVSFVDKIFSTVVGITVTQTYTQAIISGASEKEAKKGCYLAAVWMLPLALPFLAIGWFMHHAYPALPAVQSLPFFVTMYLPHWLGGLALGAIYISIIGSIAGLSLGAATSVTFDICRDFLGWKNPKALLYSLRLAIIILTLAAFAVSIMNYESHILYWNFLSFSLRGAGIFFLLLIAVRGYRFVPAGYAPGIILLSTAVAFLHLLYPIKGAEIFTPLDMGIGMSMVLLVMAWVKNKKDA